MDAVNQAEPEPAQKTYQKILEQEVAEGLRELERPTLGLLISGFSAGLDVSFSVLLMGVMTTLLRGQVSEAIAHILVANTYAVGFVFVVLGRSELFTEHTTRAVYPVLTRRASMAGLLRLWLLIYVSNLTGTAIFARLATLIGPALRVIDPSAFVEIGRRAVTYPWWVILLSAMMAGWLMGLLSWLVTAGRDTMSQIFFVWLITSAIGICRLPHSVVGSAEVLAAVFVKGLGMKDYGHFMLWATAGNIIGGAVFVALLKYSHVIRGGGDPVDFEESRGERLITP